VHLPKRVALKLLWRAFEQSKSSSAFVEVSGTEATECGKLFLLFGISKFNDTEIERINEGIFLASPTIIISKSSQMTYYPQPLPESL
jgi:hypothetical protein